jgi:protein phosphatase
MNSLRIGLCLDCELMPWLAKAQELLRQQYATTGAAARAGLAQAIGALTLASGRQPEAKSTCASSMDRNTRRRKTWNGSAHGDWEPKDPSHFENSR